MVQEVKSTFEQIEADLDIPQEKIQTREEKEQEMMLLSSVV